MVTWWASLYRVYGVIVVQERAAVGVVGAAFEMGEEEAGPGAVREDDGQDAVEVYVDFEVVRLLRAGGGGHFQGGF